MNKVVFFSHVPFCMRLKVEFPAQFGVLLGVWWGERGLISHVWFIYYWIHGAITWTFVLLYFMYQNTLTHQFQQLKMTKLARMGYWLRVAGIFKVKSSQINTLSPHPNTELTFIHATNLDMNFEHMEVDSGQLEMESGHLEAYFGNLEVDSREPGGGSWISEGGL